MVSDMELRLEPKQVLQVSPQMLLATRMLLMPAQELSDYLARAAEENPLLERLEPCGFSSGRERTYAVEPPHTAEVGRWDASMTSLAASLTEQIERLRQDKATTALCTYMVQLLDENGYLPPEDLEDIRQLGIEQTLIDRALAILQSLEPAGVGAPVQGSACCCNCSDVTRGRGRRSRSSHSACRCWPKSSMPPLPGSWDSRSRRFVAPAGSYSGWSPTPPDARSLRRSQSMYCLI